jgi:hypothetical protein
MNTFIMYSSTHGYMTDITDAQWKITLHMIVLPASERTWLAEPPKNHSQIT